MAIESETKIAAEIRPVVLRAGFRPFFLLAGVQAASIVPVWLGQMLAGIDLDLPYPPALWHGHEMVFGFAGAAIAGFLLTAVPSWTGTTGLKGRPLALLAVLWLAARLAFWTGLSPWLAGALDIAFFPALGAVLAAPLIGAGKFRNIAFLPLLALLAVADGLVLGEMTGVSRTGWSGLIAGLFLLLVMISIVGGRIVPAFTGAGLRAVGIVVEPKSRRWLDLTAIAAVAATGLAEAVVPEAAATGALALLAALLQLVRLAGWYGWRTTRVPLLWVLHLGYLWLPIGLVLFGLSAFVPAVTPQLALHALTVGCVGLMVLGVMTRAALGHAGRPLQPATATVVAYGLVFLGAVVRVFGVMVDPLTGLWLSGLLWTAGFLIYLVVYAPICLSPRADGRPG